MAKNDNLEVEVEDLKKQLTYLTKTVIPQLQEQITNGGSGSTDSGNQNNSSDNNSSSNNSSSTSETWTVVYDKKSEDAAVNLGYTTGITGSIGQIASFPNLLPYTRLRVHFSAFDAISIHEFDITDTSDNFYRFHTTNNLTTILVGMSFTLAVREGKRLIEFLNCTKIEFFSNKYTGMTSLKNNTLYHISKIEARG